MEDRLFWLENEKEMGFYDILSFLSLKKPLKIGDFL